MPLLTPFSNTFLDREAFEGAIRRRARGRCESAGWEAVAIDGKTLRGTAGHEVPR